MTKVTGPLFGTSANGNIGDLGYFRTTGTTSEFIAAPDVTARKPTTPRPIHRCFAEAKAAHHLIPAVRVKEGDVWHTYRTPSWPDFWRQWLVDHPDCRA